MHIVVFRSSLNDYLCTTICGTAERSAGTPAPRSAGSPAAPPGALFGVIHLMIHFVLVRTVFAIENDGRIKWNVSLNDALVLVRMVFMQRTEDTIKWKLHLMMHFVLVRMVFMPRTEGIIKWRSFNRNKELLNSISF